jgi:hypothetical protein
MQLQGDTAPEQCQTLIQKIILIILQMKQLSEQVILTQRDIQVKFTDQENLVKHFLLRELWNFKSTLQIKLIYTVQDKHSLIIVLVMLWTLPFGIVQAGLLRITFILIRLELNTENNSINPRISIREKSENRQEEFQRSF